MSYSFPKVLRLRRRSQYQRVSHSSIRYVGQWIILDLCPNQGPLTRLGITVTHHFGKAHDRNRFKRIVREAFRLCRGRLAPSLDIVIKPRSQAKKATTANIQEELLRYLSI